MEASHTTKSLLLTALLALVALTAEAKKPVDHLDRIGVTADVTRDKTTDSVTLALTLTLDDLRLGTNDLLLLTPRIASDEGSYTRLLEPLYIVGGTREKALSRQLRFGHLPDYYATAEPQSITRRTNGRPQQVRYSVTLPYEPEMAGATLFLDEWLTGCADCDGGTATRALLTPFVLRGEPYSPTYRASYIVPEVEQVKSRQDKFSATIAFPLDKDRIDRAYSDNAAVLDDVDTKVRAILDNDDLTLTELVVEGWASPEGRAEYNRALSDRRARAFADYLVRTHGLKRSDMTVTGRGEDWDGVEKLVADWSRTDERDALRPLFDNYSGDARDPEIKALEGGAVYRHLLDEIYPQVRRTDYTLAYTVRGFDLDEAREVMKTNPRLLSLNEIYLVATGYPAGSDLYKEAFRTAARLFPGEPVALINAAAADLEAGDAAMALRRLAELPADETRALNNRAIALALTGDYDAAREAFEAAIKAGDSHAADNLAELRKVLDSLTD